MTTLKTAFEIAREKVPGHPIPPMTDPLSKYWNQPSRFEIEIDETHALMSHQTFNALPDYSNSRPTGAYEGKMWRCCYLKGGWWLHWFGPHEKPDLLKVHGRKILVVRLKPQELLQMIEQQAGLARSMTDYMLPTDDVDWRNPQPLVEFGDFVVYARFKQ